MTKTDRRKDINNRYGLAIAERSLQPKGSIAYNEITKVINLIRREYQNGVYTRIVLKYDPYTHHYYGVDTASQTIQRKY